MKLENGKQVSGYSPRLFGARLQRFMKLHCVFCHKKIHDRKRPSFSTGWRNVHFGESHICEVLATGLRSGLANNAFVL